jgi:hypothetical protein
VQYQKSKTSRKNTINTESLATLTLNWNSTSYLNTLIRFSGFLANTITYFLRLGKIQLQVFEKIKNIGYEARVGSEFQIFPSMMWDLGFPNFYFKYFRV